MSCIRHFFVLAVFFSLVSPLHASPQQQFFDQLGQLCGQAFAGQLTHHARPGDDGWLDRDVVIHFRSCSDDEIRIPLHVGDNRSRTWVIQRREDRLILKHDHRHEDGSEDAVTWYGGHTEDEGRETRQTFPADAYSKSLFLANGLEPSIENFWSLELHPGQKLVYEMVRSRRHFRAEFDLRSPIDAPPAPWGWED
jgi:hypothetical protein